MSDPARSWHDDPDLPLAIEPVGGWRVWTLARTPQGLRLRSIHHDGLWVPGQPFEAACHLGHRAPSAGCTCGVYAASSLEALWRSGVQMHGTVLGTVSMWRRVVEHTTGVRSALAYPSRLRLVCGPCARVGAWAAEPVAIADEGETVLPLCEEHRTRFGSSSAADVRSELLSTYGVELLPAPPRPPVRLPVPVGTSAPTPPRPGRRILELVGMGVIRLIGLVVNVVMALFVLGSIAGLVLGVGEATLRFVGVLDEPPPAAAATLPATMVVCGIVGGGVVAQVECGTDEDVWGFASREAPGGPDADCVEGAVSYSSGRDWWICWHPALGDQPLDIDRLTTTADPFHGSID